MKIGIDISQIVYQGTGVGRYVQEVVKVLLSLDQRNEYVLFASSLRQRRKFYDYYRSLGAQTNRVRLVCLPIPPTLLDFLWNKLHLIPIEWFIGPVDIFWSSDWTQPPLARALGVTTIHDLSFFRYPLESYSQIGISVKNLQIYPNIVATQKRRLAYAREECRLFFCDSEATAADAKKYLNLDKTRLRVIYPGYQL